MATTTKPKAKKDDTPSDADAPLEGQLAVEDALAEDTPAPGGDPAGAPADTDTDEQADDAQGPGLPGSWNGLLALFGVRDAEGRVLAEPPPGQPPLPPMPLPFALEWPDPATRRVSVGSVERIWTDPHGPQGPGLYGCGSLDLEQPHARDLAQHLSGGPAAARLEIAEEGEDAEVPPGRHYASWSPCGVLVRRGDPHDAPSVVAVW